MTVAKSMEKPFLSPETRQPHLKIRHGIKFEAENKGEKHRGTKERKPN